MSPRSALKHLSVRALAVALLTVIAVACGSSGQSASSEQPSPSPQPASFSDYDAALCGAFTSLIRAYGNPDTNSQSVMRKALEDALTAGDPAAAQRASAAMLNELEAGRRLAASAARWQPGATTAVSLDRLLLAFEAWTSAKLALASDPSATDPQKAFEKAGGVEAWAATLNGVARTPVPSGASPTPCRAFTGQI
jgi:hypothetical protein